MKLPDSTLMFAEAAEASAVAARQYDENSGAIEDLAKKLRKLAPHTIFTCARGSSDHAATFAKYLFETQLGIATISYAPSLSSVSGRSLGAMAGQVFCAISQSGQSPDLVLSAKAAKRAGALVIALVNNTLSDLADAADVVVPLHAGPERSVAATKSFIATQGALLHLAAQWSQAGDLIAARQGLPEQLALAWQCDWTPAVDLFRDTRSLYVLGRGLTLGSAQEAALKFKETCSIHAEAFSAAEVIHGPMALVGPDFPLLVFPPSGRDAAGFDETLALLSGRGGKLAVAGGGPTPAIALPLPSDLPAVCAPIATVQAFYRCINALAVARGFDPDSPPGLNKVTRTL